MDERSAAFDAAWFARASGGELANGIDAGLSRVDTDSRAVGPGSLFVALAGERVDGHEFALSAARAGASAVLVSATWWRERGRAAFAGLSAAVIVADATLPALQKAAKAWRSRFPSCLRFGVTGSSGKTTVKELLASILGATRSVVKNPGNLNSDIGLPAALFQLRAGHEAAVFEMGINKPGEMDVLADIYQPDCAVITNVGTAHIGPLGGTQESVAYEKRRVASRFDGRQTLVVGEDERWRDYLVFGLDGRAATFGVRSVEGFEGCVDRGSDGWTIRYRGLEAGLALPGAHNLMNALAAIRAAELYGASPTDVRDGLAAARTMPGRSEILRGAFTVVNDCYNANAESVLAALALCDGLPATGRRLYVLGSMKELGERSRESHERVGRAAAASRADALYFYGDEAAWALEAARAAGTRAETCGFVDYEGLAAAVKAAAAPGDLVLLKASRSMALERLAAELLPAGGRDAP